MQDEYEYQQFWNELDDLYIEHYQKELRLLWAKTYFKIENQRQKFDLLQFLTKSNNTKQTEEYTWNLMKN